MPTGGAFSGRSEYRVGGAGLARPSPLVIPKKSYPENTAEIEESQ